MLETALLIESHPEVAFQQFGFGALGITVEDLSTAHRIIQLGVQPNRIELVTSIFGISFDEAWSSRVPAAHEGIEVAFIGREARIGNKRASGRGSYSPVSAMAPDQDEAAWRQ